jgi:hypothetical protein
MSTHNMYFDSEQSAVVDLESGEIIPIDLLTGAEQLPSYIEDDMRAAGYVRSGRGTYERLRTQPSPERTVSSRRSDGYAAPGISVLGSETELEVELRQIHLRDASAPPLRDSPAGEEVEEGRGDDWTLAKALQAMEFEIVQDTYRDPITGDFNEKEYRASSCKRQLLTLSTLVCLIQIGVLVAMVQDDGYAPKSENPMIGPPAVTMVSKSHSSKPTRNIPFI